MIDGSQVGHWEQRGVGRDLLGDFDRVVARASAGAVRHRDEGRVQRFQLANRLPQPAVVFAALRGEELEGERRLSGVQTLAHRA
jgi:hypothetical protein